LKLNWLEGEKTLLLLLLLLLLLCCCCCFGGCVQLAALCLAALVARHSGVIWREHG
jgi:hypothetical protein